MKETTNTTRNMAMEHSSGQMEENMPDTGKMENNMAGESTTYRTDRKRSENGSKVKRLSGSKKTHLKKHDKLRFFALSS